MYSPRNTDFSIKENKIGITIVTANPEPYLKSSLPPTVAFPLRQESLTTHMMQDRMAPEEPMRAPTMVNRLLLSRKPSAHRAQPEQLFSTVMTTGMSAPPIAAVKVTPQVQIKEEIKIILLASDGPMGINSNQCKISAISHLDS